LVGALALEAPRRLEPHAALVIAIAITAASRAVVGNVCPGRRGARLLRDIVSSSGRRSWLCVPSPNAPRITGAERC
jgi:hypothetical protein